jgi:hypothetical protein
MSHSGNCLTFDPQKTSRDLPWSFTIPVPNTTSILNFYVTRTTGWDGNLTVRIYDPKDMTTPLYSGTISGTGLPINDGVGEDWSFVFSSTAFVPSTAGLAQVYIGVTQGKAATGDVFIDGVSIV